MIYKVVLSKRAEKDLKKIPSYIADRFFKWFDMVDFYGLEESRKIKSYHDEPLKGLRKGQRSIRLSKSYRAIYMVKEDGVNFCEIQEVHKHDY